MKASWIAGSHALKDRATRHAARTSIQEISTSTDLRLMLVNWWCAVCQEAREPAKLQVEVRQGCQKYKRSHATQSGSAAMVTLPALPNCLQHQQGIDPAHFRNLKLIR